MGLITKGEAGEIRSLKGQHSLGADHRLHIKKQRFPLSR